MSVPRYLEEVERYLQVRAGSGIGVTWPVCGTTGCWQRAPPADAYTASVCRDVKCAGLPGFGTPSQRSCGRSTRHVSTSRNDRQWHRHACVPSYALQEEASRCASFVGMYSARRILVAAQEALVKKHSARLVEEAQG